MALPLNVTPSYQLEVPSTGQKVNYRPFLIKEEKALLIAQQSEDPKVMVESLKEVIKSCVKDDLDVNVLALFDLEYIFTQIRAKSVGEVVELIFPCDTCTDENAKTKVSLDLTKIQVVKSAEHQNTIPLFGDVGVMMKYPNMDTLQKLESLDVTDFNTIFSIVAECIEAIYNNEEVFYTKDQTKEEVLEFLGNLTSEQFGKVQKFFETMPKMKQDVEYKCPVCNKEHKKTLEGLQSFF
jgi:hypothetical protein